MCDVRLVTRVGLMFGVCCGCLVCVFSSCAPGEYISFCFNHMASCLPLSFSYLCFHLSFIVFADAFFVIMQFIVHYIASLLFSVLSPLVAIFVFLSHYISSALLSLPFPLSRHFLFLAFYLLLVACVLFLSNIFSLSLYLVLVTSYILFSYSILFSLLHIVSYHFLCFLLFSFLLPLSTS